MERGHLDGIAAEVLPATPAELGRAIARFARNVVMDGLCSGDAVWYFQPWLIGQGRRWYQHAARDPGNLADLPAVRPLAGRHPRQWPKAEWPWWEKLAYVAPRVHDYVTGREDSIADALAKHGGRAPSGSAPADQARDFDSPAESQRHLPRHADLFPRRQRLKD